jgi:hypothetical protein
MGFEGGRIGGPKGTHNPSSVDLGGASLGQGCGGDVQGAFGSGFGDDVGNSIISASSSTRSCCMCVSRGYQRAP